MDMNYATNIAILDDDGFITNIIWGMIYQLDEFNRTYTRAVVIGGYELCIGDQYYEGKWYRNGKEITALTPSQRADEVESILDMLYEGAEVTDE